MDQLVGHLYGTMIGQAGHIGSLQGTLRATEEIVANVKQTVLRFRCDDAALRAVIRAMIKELRDSEKSSKLTDKGERDKIFTTAYESRMVDDKFDPGWDPHLANRRGLLAVAKALDEELKIHCPESELIGDGNHEKSGKAFIYKENFNAEADKVEPGKHWPKWNMTFDWSTLPFGLAPKTDSGEK